MGDAPDEWGRDFLELSYLKTSQWKYIGNEMRPL